MKESAVKILTKLKQKKRKGVSFSDFPTGTDYRTRISELLKAGYVIHSEYETLPTGCRRKRYWLVSEPSAVLRVI